MSERSSPPGAETPTRFVADYYDGAAETWDQQHGVARQNPVFAQQLRKQIRDLLGSETGKPVALEIGAGTGPYLDITAPLFGKLTATDISQGMLAVLARRAKHLGLANVEARQQDAYELKDIAEASVDVVYSIGLLETVNDFDRLFAEVYRVLKPGGLLAGITSNGSCPWYSIRRWREGGERHGRTGFLLTDLNLDAILRRAGFLPIEATHWGAVPAGLGSRPISAVLAAAESIIAPTPLARYLGVLSFRSRKPPQR